MTSPSTLYEKLVARRTVRRIDENHVLLYVDLHVMNEYTSPQAFSGLSTAERTVRRPRAAFAIVDHVNTTTPGRAADGGDRSSRLLIDTLRENCARHGIAHFGAQDPRQGIEHVVVPELGLALPGMVIACGDSHTTTYGAFGALGFGIGTSEVEHLLTTQTLVYRPLKTMHVIIDGAAGPGVTAKDLVLALIGIIGASGATGYAVEFSGDALRRMSMEGRMTICNMAVEAGARAALIAPDDNCFAWLQGKTHAPTGPMWEAAVAQWRDLRSDAGATFDRTVHLDAGAVMPQVTWGTSPDQVIPIDGLVPDPACEPDDARRQTMERALDYMGLAPGQGINGLRVDRVFIGSCTNSRIEDLRAAAEILRGRTVADHVRAMVVPGSWQVRRQAEAEGLADVFTNAGFEWRLPGCSMCLAMNDDIAAPGERCASSTNRNFEGRQGRSARTHLMSPAMAAAAAVAGHIADPRQLVAEVAR